MTAELIERFGPRISGTEANRRARAELRARLAEICPETRLEPFRIHPGSLYSIGRIFSLLYLAGTAAAFSSAAWTSVAALVLMALGLAYFISQFVLYLELFDPLFPGADAENIVGIVEPTGRAARQIVLVGHHDSAPVCPFHERLPLLYPIRIFVPIAFYLFGLIVHVLRVAALAVGGAAIDARIALLLAGGMILVAPMFFFISKRGSPGASDNLIGCAIAIQAAKALRGALASTRLIVLLSDGEEVGQKGARAFLRLNRSLLDTVPTTVINIDSIVDERDLTLLDRDRNGFTKLSAALIGDMKRAASDSGIELAVKSMPMGGGGTDAGQFAHAGYDTAAIIGVSLASFRKEIVHHTMSDTADRISPPAIASTISIVLEYARCLDRS